MNEYDARELQLEKLIESRLQKNDGQQRWDYEAEVKATQSNRMPYKYNAVNPTPQVDFDGSLKELIFDKRISPEDTQLFEGLLWNLVPFSEEPYLPPPIIPPVHSKSPPNKMSQLADQYYGKVQQSGMLAAKASQVNYVDYYYNLRQNALVLYPAKDYQSCLEQSLVISINENSFDFLSPNTDQLSLKGPIPLKIHRQQKNIELIHKMMRKMLFFAYRGAYFIRDTVPDPLVLDFIDGRSRRLGPVNFVHQSSLKDLSLAKTYRETIGAFFALLNQYALERGPSISGQIHYPLWLKQQYRQVPIFETAFFGNVIPKQMPLQTLKLYLQQNQVQSLIQVLKFIFPYYRTVAKRTLIIYQSSLTDTQAKLVLSQVMFPMFHIGFPSNRLTMSSLQAAVEGANKLTLSQLDFSYNGALQFNEKVMLQVNSSPSLRTIDLRGCRMERGKQAKFFMQLNRTVGLKEVYLDLLREYVNPIVKDLNEFDFSVE